VEKRMRKKTYDVGPWLAQGAEKYILDEKDEEK